MFLGIKGKLTYSDWLKLVALPSSDLNTIGREEMSDTVTILIPDSFERAVRTDPCICFVAHAIV